jgi:hypothetical protein
MIAAQGLTSANNEEDSKKLIQAVFELAAKALGRNSHRAVMADTQNLVREIFTKGNIEFYTPAPGRKIVRETPDEWIRRVLEPLVDSDMKRDS